MKAITSKIGATGVQQNRSLGFNGSAVDTIAASVPFWSRAKINGNGMPLGTTFDNDAFYYNPFDWMKRGLCANLIQMNTAKIGFGKTTLVDMIAAVVGGWKIGTGAGEYEMRIWADNIRKLHGTIELERLAKFFDSDVIDGNRRINPLDPAYGLSSSTQLTFMLGLLQQANKGKELTGYAPYALRVGLYHMRQHFAKQSSLELLRDLFRVMDTNYERAYYEATRLDVSDMTEEQKRKLDQPANLNVYEWRRACFELYMLLDDVSSEDGTFEGRFGGQESTAELIKTQRANIIDLSDTQDVVITQMQALYWLVRQTASKQQNRDFMFQIEIHDENWKLWQYLVYAVAMFQHIKQIRSEETLVLMNNHKYTDYETVGEAGSQQRDMATKMVSDVGIWMMGHQEREDANNLQHKLGLSGNEEDMLTKLKRGQWGCKVGDEPVVFFDTTPMFNKYFEEMTASNQALSFLLNEGKQIEDTLEMENA